MLRVGWNPSVAADALCYYIDVLQSNMEGKPIGRIGSTDNRIRYCADFNRVACRYLNCNWSYLETVSDLLGTDVS